MELGETHIMTWERGELLRRWQEELFDFFDHDTLCLPFCRKIPKTEELTGAGVAQAT